METDVLYLFSEVGGAGVHVVGVLFEHPLGERPAGLHFVVARVVLQGPNRGHQHRCVGPEARDAALDVEEPLGAHVRAEAGFGDKEVSAADADQVRHDRGVAGGYVAERSSVDQGRRVLQCLHQIRFYGLLHDDRHSARGLQVLGSYGLTIGGAADNDPSQSLPQVSERRGERQNSHDLGGGGDVEARLAGNAVPSLAEASDHVPQGAVVYVQNPPPGDSVPIHIEEVVVVVDVVVYDGREEVVGRRDRVVVAGQVQVERLHRHHLAVAAARGAALDPKSGAHRGLADGDRGSLADVFEGLPEPHGGRRLTLTQRRGGYGRDQHVPRPRSVLELLYGL